MSEKYDYRAAMAADIREYLADHNITTRPYDESAQADQREKLHDALWICDSVTGNASGSYTFSTWKAEEYICHNLDLLADAVSEFGGEVDVLEKGAEWCDVTIRCYLLCDVLDEVLGELPEVEVQDGVPCWAASYIVNGDSSGLTDEDKKLVDDFVDSLAKCGYRLVSPIDGTHNDFNRFPCFGDACDTEDWTLADL